MVIGKLAMGNLHGRGEILGALPTLPGAVVASHDEVMDFIERVQLHGQGVGYVDAHLLASVRLTPDARLWTLDRRLGDLAARIGGRLTITAYLSTPRTPRIHAAMSRFASSSSGPSM